MLELTNLSKTYDGFGFGPVDLSVSDEVLAVLGPSGSGKTTLLSLIAGIIRPDAGSISLNDCLLVGRPPEERRTGLVFQDGALFPHMTARENIAYATDDLGYIRELAELLEIKDVLDRRPRTLSGGERQRVALARTVAAEPDALLLDEPLSSLDAPIRRRLRDELHDLFESLHIPIIYVTHDQRAATALGDRIAVLRDGVVEQVGSPADILNRPETRFVASFSGNENIFEAKVIDQNGGAVSLRIEDVTLQANVEDTVGPVVTTCIRPSRIQLSSPDEDTGEIRVNTLPGTIHRWLNEGDEYRVILGIGDANVNLTATVPPASFERLTVESGSCIRASVPPDAIHLIR